MSSRPNVISDYSNLDQTANTFAVAPTLRNAIFEFYLPLPNGRITYTELDSLEIARLLNNRIDLSHVVIIIFNPLFNNSFFNNPLIINKITFNNNTLIFNLLRYIRMIIIQLQFLQTKLFLTIYEK